MFTRIVECYAKAGAWNTTRSGRTRRWATGRRHRKLSCQSNRGMEIWKTLRVFHIPTPPATPPHVTRGDRKIVPPRAAERWWMQLPRYRLLLVSETVPRVRIPPAPPYSLKCRETRLDCSGICGKWPQIPQFLLSNRAGESLALNSSGQL